MVDPTSPLLLIELNEDCLLKLFEYCGVETLLALCDVCRMFRALITTKVLPRVKEYDCCLYCDGDRSKRIIKHIGPYLKRLDIKCYEFFRKENYLSYLEDFSFNIGENIREMTLILPDFPVQLIEVLAPSFKCLESLKICTRYNKQKNDIDFRATCPNLLHFYMGMEIPFEANTQTWNRLESFSFGDNCHKSISKTTLLEFLSNNSQLKRLKISTRDGVWKISDIIDRLKNLEQWTIMHDGGNFKTDLHLLDDFESLIDLRIMRIPTASFDAIVAELPKCRRLRHLKLQACNSSMAVFKPNQSHIFALAHRLKHLETFEISYCRLDEALVLEFIQVATVLKELHIHNCWLELTEEFIQDIVRVRLSLNLAKNAEPLRICDDKELFSEVSQIRCVSNRNQFSTESVH